MLFRDVAIESLTYELPANAVSTADIEVALAPFYARTGLQAGCLAALTGVRERRFWPIEVRPWQMAVRAGERALAEAGLAPGEVDVLVSTSVCRDELEPSVASGIHRALGLPPSCRNLDVGNACLGFLSGMAWVAGLIDAGLIRTGLVVAGEGSREVVEATIDRLLAPEATGADFGAHLATLTLGSAAVAAVLTDGRRARNGHRLRGDVALAATEHNDLCRGDLGGMKTDGTKLLEVGVGLATRTWAEAATAFRWDGSALACYAMHQVSRVHHRTLSQTLGLPPGRAPEIFDILGNIGAAGVPVTLARALEAGQIQSGDTVALMGIGSGLNCAIQELRW